eukprot:CAMPEP_0184350174 /NCGR_PEP_ID=MMETSP1089-20130417/37522_1 /TAXON_ID=38269 ORGANISM="Gloeochaete wittrockiana, Strain SAG46.84" /NCGR_SAMPLE_ID=MMETSP1089 /ASSEMBLY_ACC=CAM_ASM_000445 /LENGTH=470 /DNA_ID=CAMNT_0026682763 /DNA_START=35 /DNA_END=1447 /DNA_ORIENTATION=+
MTGKIVLVMALLAIMVQASTSTKTTPDYASKDVAQSPPFKVTGLPNLKEAIPFQQYTGYIVVNTTYERSLFYWFMESQSNPATDPVVLWLQGGPGCAGSWAIFQEHGPYRILPNDTVTLNNLSWNKKANVIYIDAPAGVGFSYANTTLGLQNNDNETALDNYNFLQGFFQVFPQFQSNPLWITGESYGGVYVPTLVNNIIDGPNQQLKNALKGFMVGNPVLSCPDVQKHGLSVQLNLYYNHALVPFSNYRKWYSSGCNDNELHPACAEMFQSFVAAIGPLDKDDLYTNWCVGNGTLDAMESVPNCYSLGQRTEHYLNNPLVQQAINAFPQPKKWYFCTPHLPGLLSYNMSGMDILPFYTKFFNVAPHLRIMIYSGDADIADVPHAKTQLCLSYLNRTMIEPWRRWTVQGHKIPAFIPQSQEKSQVTAGYVEVYDSYTYATVKGAGHMVPMYQPFMAYNLFDRFIVQGITP